MVVHLYTAVLNQMMLHPCAQDLWEVAAEMRIALRATKEACKRRNVAPHLD